MTGVSDHSPQFQFYLDSPLCPPPYSKETVELEKNKASYITAYFKNENHPNVY